MALSKGDTLYLQMRLTKLKRRKSILQNLMSNDKNREDIREIETQINTVKDWLKGL